MKVTSFILLLALLLTVQADTIPRLLTTPLDDLIPQAADTVYYNGKIITMDDVNPYVAFVAVKDKKIVKASFLQDEMGLYVGKDTKMIDLHGRTMLPGFIDAHCHFGLTGVYLNQKINIQSPPFGRVRKIQDLLDILKEYAVHSDIPEGEVIYAEGYSDIDMEENRHPTRYELDWVSTKHPIFLRHFSEHAFAVNSKGLDYVNYNRKTKDPSGGHMDRYANGTLTGVLREKAIFPILLKYAVNLDDLNDKQIKNIEDLYFSVGVTTVQDIIINPEDNDRFKEVSDKLLIDINSYVYIDSRNLSVYYDAVKNKATQRNRIKGVKIVLDGSIQAYTALLSKPYWVKPEHIDDNLTNYVYNESRSCEDQGQDCGIDYFPNKKILREVIKDCYENQITVFAHTNGDQASENFLDAIEWAKKNSQLKKNTRFVMIHGQMLREDQLDRMVELDVHASFFPIHIYYWGDKHYQLFMGPERANRMNPVKSAIKRNIVYTIHNDSPVVITGFVDGQNTFLQILESAVVRKTLSGRVLGEDERISVYDALKGVTINSAWQSNMENEAGSITLGKQADFVILDENPLMVDPEHLSQIKIVTTIKGDKKVYGVHPKKQVSQQVLEPSQDAEFEEF